MPTHANAEPIRLLFASSEVYPLVKTGGLADVSASLPRALSQQGLDVRVIMPAYREAVARAGTLRRAASLSLPRGEASLLQGRLPHSRVALWLVDYPPLFDRPGNPYLDAEGQPWPDNAERFALFARAAAMVAVNGAGLDWRPDVVHANDWQAGLIPALLALEAQRPATVFTVHNLAYQGLFSSDVFTALGLPPQWRSFEALEFHGGLSYIKGGLVFADRINTVSPTYAREIQTEAFGCGLEGLLAHRQRTLTGILNGIDTHVWDPLKDRLIAENYGRSRLDAKRPNKVALQREFGLPEQPDTFLIGMIGRLVTQKGIDLVIDALPRLMDMPLQIVLLGSGESGFEQALRAFAQRYPQSLAIRVGYDETLAHRIEAGADAFLMPSRFEPCGLNQMYSQRYGTVPIVRRVGGLADTVIDVTSGSLTGSTATGVVFDAAAAEALISAVERASKLYKDKGLWRQLQKTGMRQDFSWRKSAEHYLELYKSLT